MDNNKNTVGISDRIIELNEGEAWQRGVFAEDALSLEEALAAIGGDGDE